MPFVQAKCPECGGMLAVDDSKKAAICQFCGEAFIVQKAIINNNTYITNDNRTTHNYGDGAVVNVYENQNPVSALIERVFMFLEDGNFISANEYCEKVLDIEPENAQAYLGKLMAELKVRRQEDLKNCNTSFYNNNNYQKILRFGDDNLKKNLVARIEHIETRNEKARQERERQEEIERQEAEQAQEEINQKRKELAKVQGLISAGYAYTVGLKSNGTVIAVGSNFCNQCNVVDWTDIVAVSAGVVHTVGLKSDGTVVATKFIDSDFRKYYGQSDVSDWTDIVAIAAGDSHTVGLKSDGTVVAVGYDYYNQCYVSNWRDIVAISASGERTFGLKSDGTVVFTKYSLLDGRVEYLHLRCDVSNWTDVVAISGSDYHIVGLKSDGTVISKLIYNNTNVFNSSKHDSGQCDVLGWRDIVAISAGSYHTVGLKSDGTVVAVGGNKYGQCDVSHWTDIVGISAGYKSTVGLKSDGTVVASGYNSDYQMINNWKLFNDINNLEEEQKVAREVLITENEQQAQYRSQGLCQHCGGTFKGLFSPKCSNCGKPKDY